MDENLRALQRQYERGEINVVQWMKALQRAGIPYHELLIQTWEKLLSVDDATPQFTVSGVANGYASYLHAAIELLEAFPVRCTCRHCVWVSHNGFCTCVLTGICAPHRDGYSGPGKVIMSTFGPTLSGCLLCDPICPVSLPDAMWSRPGKLALEVVTIKAYLPLEELRFSTFCNAYHFQPTSSGDEYSPPNNQCRGNTRQQLIFIMKHATCRIDAGLPEEHDEDLESWRDMLSELGPGELPPY